MFDDTEWIGRDAGDLLLKILEMPRSIVTAAAIEILGSHRAAPLIAARLLKPSGHEHASTSISDHDDAPVALTWSAEHGGYGYFSSTAGWTTVRNDEITRYGADFPVFFARLVLALEFLARSGPVSLVPDLLWEIGEVRLGRRIQRVPIWFVRRIYDASVWRQVKEAARARPDSRLRVVLTSTPSHRLPEQCLSGHLVVSVRDVIDFTACLSIHPGILAARLDGTYRPDIAATIYLSPDGRRLVINGDVIIDFKSDIHVAIVRKLVQGFKDGKRYSARELLDHSQSSAKTLRQAFGTQRWAKLKPYLKSENRLWGFDL